MARFGECDVVVAGAGFAGLSAADALVREGLTVRVVEARPRVGGRALTRFLPDGTQLDLGGQWIGPAQRHMADLVHRHAVRTYPTPSRGAALIEYGGRRVEELPAEAAEVLAALDRLARAVPPDRPWSAPGAAGQDGRTFASWLAATGAPPAARDLVGRLVSGGLLSAGPTETSLLETLFYVASGGGTEPLLGYEGGAQETRFAGGAQHLAERMAAGLPEGTLRLGQPVEAVEYTPRSARVHTPGGAWDAAQVVLAVPPVLAGRVRYSPALPPLRAGLLQRMPAGTALKTHAVYTAPFWRAAGLSGVSQSAEGVLTETVDNTPPDAPRAVLTGFAYGAEAVLLRRQAPATRRRAVLDHLTALFGEEAGAPDDFVEFDWLAEEWTRGCFSGHLVPGAWTTFGPSLREPVGPLHWAGTETAVRWNGYFEGAVESGYRAAEEVRRSL
ncbi:flavin monoamine oxidase family protein [Streptomyces diastaticus]|uniref:flavin monoamine oxidase family protein n=1 Tax=Streptomyces TaxID=1883 RepID=UPI0018ACA243|nr:FAD-dependent oxidoreductase [Streptomyces sp. BRB081]MBL3807829.1 FAD-dependent oxidoreductase [Streptomyces sp. BRB081]